MGIANEPPWLVGPITSCSHTGTFFFEPPSSLVLDLAQTEKTFALLLFFVITALQALQGLDPDGAVHH
tara:strand:+ start:12812 stop:13015 length:204 start_codon:yes stop_codon:yes gene_type:complete